MTGWQILQWIAALVGAVGGVASVAWIVTQGRKLHREERERKQLEATALALVDEIRRLLSNDSASTHVVIEPEKREAAMLAERWGALSVRWHGGQMHARLATFSDR